MSQVRIEKTTTVASSAAGELDTAIDFPELTPSQGGINLVVAAAVITNNVLPLGVEMAIGFAVVPIGAETNFIELANAAPGMAGMAGMGVTPPLEVSSEEQGRVRVFIRGGRASVQQRLDITVTYVPREAASEYLPVSPGRIP